MNSNDIGIAEARNRLRENAQNEATCIALNDMLKDAQEEVRRLREENERLRVQLAGCGVAAMQNTADSRAHRITRDDYGWSASYADVCSAVDREISLREENERLRENAKIIYELEQLAARSNNELLVENERLRNDAERYQWLRDNEDELSSRILRMVRDGDPDLDSAIDAARGAK